MKNNASVGVAPSRKHRCDDVRPVVIVLLSYLVRARGINAYYNNNIIILYVLCACARYEHTADGSATISTRKTIHYKTKRRNTICPRLVCFESSGEHRRSRGTTIIPFPRSVGIVFVLRI